MTKSEFLAIMAFIEAGIGRGLDPPAEGQFVGPVDVYFEMLGDLPAHVFQIAAKRVVLDHPWKTFPSVAELRQAAAQTMAPQLELSAAEAWKLAWQAACGIDLEIDGSLARRTRDLPPLVLEAMTAYGIPDLCYGKESMGVVRAQFTKIYEQLLARDRKLALLPAVVKREIAQVGAGKLAAPVVKAIGQIGKDV